VAGGGSPLARAELLPRLASLVYEALILTAVVLLATLVWQGAHGILTGQLQATPGGVWALRAWLVAVTGGYFCGFWMRGGQTLPMRTWRLRLDRADGAPLDLRSAVVRYALAWPCALVAGIGFLWALVDRDRQFLHDRLAGTRIVRVPR
jgi:uncharacterized RDD family membrane protein YckC